VFDFVSLFWFSFVFSELLLCEYVRSQVDPEEIKKEKAAQYMRYYRGMLNPKRCGDQLFAVVKALSIHDYFDVLYKLHMLCGLYHHSTGGPSFLDLRTKFRGEILAPTSGLGRGQWPGARRSGCPEVMVVDT
jgi:hypothetical protein